VRLWVADDWILFLLLIFWLRNFNTRSWACAKLAINRVERCKVKMVALGTSPLSTLIDTAVKYHWVGVPLKAFKFWFPSLLGVCWQQVHLRLHRVDVLSIYSGINLLTTCIIIFLAES
jgi:hypothetical protein